MRARVTIPAQTREIALPEREEEIEVDARRVVDDLTEDVETTRSGARWALEIGTELIGLIGPDIARRCEIGSAGANVVRGEIRERLQHLLAWLDEVPQ